MTPIANEQKRPYKVALALQGSFGHERYALGIMAAFQKHNLKFHAASGTVEMLLPLWLYFNKKDIVDYSRRTPTVQVNLGSSFLDAGTLRNYFEGVQEDLYAVLREPGSHANFHRFLADLSGFAGCFVFNRLNYERFRQEYEDFMEGVTVPVFTNALNAYDFNEVYLYSGPVAPELITKLRGGKGREVLKINLDRFIASGARAPMLAPIKVHLHANETTGGERDEYWMEGALRCNPPLNPLCDTLTFNTTPDDVESPKAILLVRFFSKRMAAGKTHNLVELNDRYTSAIFTAPLEKEIDMIDSMSKLHLQNKPPVAILDPTDEDDNGSPEFRDFVEKELDYFSHFDVLNPAQTEVMFKRGMEVGEAIVAKYDHMLVP